MNIYYPVITALNSSALGMATGLCLWLDQSAIQLFYKPGKASAALFVDQAHDLFFFASPFAWSAGAGILWMVVFSALPLIAKEKSSVELSIIQICLAFFAVAALALVSAQLCLRLATPVLSPLQ